MHLTSKSTTAVKNSFRIIVRVFFTACVFGGVLLLVPFDSIVTTLSHANVPWIVVAIVAGLATRAAAAERTYTVSRALQLPITRFQTIEALFVSNLWSLALPGVSAGSVATVYRYRACGVGVIDSIAVLVLSRLFELIAFSTTAVLGLALSSNAGDLHFQKWAWQICGLLIIGLGTVAFCWRWWNMFAQKKPTTDGTPGFTAKIMRALDALQRLSAKHVASIAVIAVLQSVLDAASMVAAALALGLKLNFLYALWINGVAYLAALLPISVAGVGVRDAAVITTTAPLGISSASAVALAALMLLVVVANALIGGIFQLRIACESRPGRARFFSADDSNSAATIVTAEGD